MEEQRTKYGENATFVQRYLPLLGHLNSMNSTVAVEAAAQQGAHEAMKMKMFETQAQWGESADNKVAVFRGYAEELLRVQSLEQFEAAVAATAAN